jgi:hypothetical protein
MRVALITTDGREHLREYDLDAPWLSFPIEVLLAPFQSAGIEVHILFCTRPVASGNQVIWLGRRWPAVEGYL